ncbi:peptidoglycan-binding domain-containing protein [Oscillibacter ruminantium]|uniref:peptidoglycan-binding domain-containing protein n=1 Tax=Oscillibacter ruminantium TaxID=1263547 RepID=UPI0002D8AF95|nr:peptidoglycan-binding protein [Oscillibacter ruminantium]
MNRARWGSPDYHGLLKDALDAIAHQLERDFERSERENNYITDDTAKNLKSAVSEQERCGISTGSTGSKIEKPAWFVNGDLAKIQQLQSKLNQLGIGEHLAEDGVYGKKTMTALETYIKTFGTGSLPVAGVMNPQLGKKRFPQRPVLVAVGPDQHWVQKAALCWERCGISGLSSCWGGNRRSHWRNRRRKRQ